MENTNEFVQKLAEDRKKQEKNKKNGNGHPDKQLPNNKH